MRLYGGNSISVSSPTWFLNVSTMYPLKQNKGGRENGWAFSLHRISRGIRKKA